MTRPPLPPTCSAVTSPPSPSTCAWPAPPAPLNGTLPTYPAHACPAPPPNTRYLCLARAAVLVSCGRDGEAAAAHEAAEAQLGRLPEGHPAEALLHSVQGHLLYHRGPLQAAFEHMVQVGEARTCTAFYLTVRTVPCMHP